MAGQEAKATEGLFRTLRGMDIVLASHNRGKIAEFAALLAPLEARWRAVADHGLPEPEETGASFAENAALKARAAMLATGMIALADDSGLEVAALEGAPGIHSARWAGAPRDFAGAMQRIETALKDKTDRSARFTCVLALCWPDGAMDYFTGHAPGRLVWPPRGGKGFGYDPMFLPDGHEQTFGEMDAAQKDKISHRAAACNALLARYF